MATNPAIANNRRIGSATGMRERNSKLDKWANKDGHTDKFMNSKRDTGLAYKGLRRESSSTIAKQQKSNHAINLRDSVCNEIKEFLSYSDGWDGEGSCRPELEVVNDAIQFVTNWSFKSKIPEPELVFDGAVALVFYDKERDSKGGIEFRKNHLGIYAVIDRHDKYESGKFNSGSIDDVLKTVKHVEKVYSYEF